MVTTLLILVILLLAVLLVVILRFTSKEYTSPQNPDSVVRWIPYGIINQKNVYVRIQKQGRIRTDSRSRNIDADLLQVSDPSDASRTLETAVAQRSVSPFWRWHAYKTHRRTWERKSRTVCHGRQTRPWGRVVKKKDLNPSRTREGGRGSIRTIHAYQLSASANFRESVEAPFTTVRVKNRRNGKSPLWIRSTASSRNDSGAP